MSAKSKKIYLVSSLGTLQALDTLRKKKKSKGRDGQWQVSQQIVAEIRRVKQSYYF